MSTSILTAPPSTNTFHPFASLPTELQIHIWQLAFLDGPCQTHAGILIGKSTSLLTALSRRFLLAPHNHFPLPFNHEQTHQYGRPWGPYRDGVLSTSIYSVYKRGLRINMKYTRENCWTWVVPNCCLTSGCGRDLDHDVSRLHWRDGPWGIESTTLLGGELGDGGGRYRMVLKKGSALVALLQSSYLGRVVVLEEWRKMLVEMIKDNAVKRDAQRVKKGKAPVVRRTMTKNGMVLDVVEKMLVQCR